MNGFLRDGQHDIDTHGFGWARDLGSIDMFREEEGVRRKYPSNSIPGHTRDRMTRPVFGRGQDILSRGVQIPVPYNRPFQFHPVQGERHYYISDNVFVNSGHGGASDETSKEGQHTEHDQNSAIPGVPQEVPMQENTMKETDASKVSRKGRRRLTVDVSMLGDKAIEMLGQRNKAEAEHFICTMTRAQLRRAFEMLYDTSTSSSNNTWLRNKLLQAIQSNAQYQYGALVCPDKDGVQKGQSKESSQSGDDRAGGIEVPGEEHAPSDNAPTSTRHNHIARIALERDNTWDINRALATGNDSSSKSDHQQITGNDGAIDDKHRCIEQSSSRWQLPASNDQHMDMTTHHNVPAQYRPVPHNTVAHDPLQLHDRYGAENMASSDVTLPTLHHLHTMMNSMERKFYTKSIQESLQRIKSSDYETYQQILGEVPEYPSETQQGRRYREQLYPVAIQERTMMQHAAPKQSVPAQLPPQRLIQPPCFEARGHHNSIQPGVEYYY